MSRSCLLGSKCQCVKVCLMMVAGSLSLSEINLVQKHPVLNPSVNFLECLHVSLPTSHKFCTIFSLKCQPLLFTLPHRFEPISVCNMLAPFFYLSICVALALLTFTACVPQATRLVGHSVLTDLKSSERLPDHLVNTCSCNSFNR